MLWSTMASMEARRCYCATAVLDGRIVALGGFDANTTRHRSVESFDITTNMWSFLPDMVTRRSDLATVVCGKTIYAIGGFTGQVYNLS